MAVDRVYPESSRTAREPPEREQVGCSYCGHGELATAGAHWNVCRGCGFLLPIPPTEQPESLSVAAIGDGIGPGVVLRDRYRLCTPLGEGPHGTTYLAQHEFLKHPCVVKVLPYRIHRGTDAAVRRLRHEASAGFRVNDPRVVRVIDFDVAEGIWYFVMEYVAGVDLASLRADGLRLDWQQAVRVARDAARGLAAIHAADLIHRDIKPGNLILGADGVTRVADLGVVGLAGDAQDLADSDPEEMVGTLAYAAPEALDRAVRMDSRADLYSLGAALYEIVTGRTPREGRGLYEMLLAADRGRPAWPADVAGDVPEWFVGAILKLLETDPGARFPSAAALLSVLDHPTVPAGGTVPAVVTGPERSEPRGLVVRTFENRSESDAQDWLGHAMADHVARALRRIPTVYVVDRTQFSTTLERIHIHGGSEGGRLRRAARLNGAGMIIEGDFVCSESVVTVGVRLLSTTQSDTMTVGRVSGPLANVAALEAQLAGLIATRLGLQSPDEHRSAGVTATAALAAQKRFFSGKRAFFRGDYEAAIAEGRHAVELDPTFVEAVGFVGVCCARMGAYDEAAEHYTRQEQLADELGDERARVEAFANRGAMHYFRGEYERADEYLNRAVSTAESLGLASDVAQISNNLGFVQLQLGRPEQAEATFRRAIETHKSLGALVSLVGPYNGLGSVLRQQKRYSEARSYFQRALTLAQESEDGVNIGVAYMNLGQCAMLGGRLRDAKNELAMALNLLEDTSFWNGLARVYEFMADLNLRLGNAPEAVRCAERRVELAVRHGNLRIEASAWRQKAEALRMAGRTDEACACVRTAEQAEARVGEGAVG